MSSKCEAGPAAHCGACDTFTHPPSERSHGVQSRLDLTGRSCFLVAAAVYEATHTHSALFTNAGCNYLVKAALYLSSIYQLDTRL